MSFYAVRTIREKELVGLFFAESIPHLVVGVSKVDFSENCEFIELGGGAIFWKSARMQVPLRPQSGLSWKECEMTPGWKEALHASDAKWMPLLATEDVVR